MRARALALCLAASITLLACASLAPLDKTAVANSMRDDAYAYAHCGDAAALCELVRAAYCSDRGIARRNGALPDGGADGGIRCEP